MGYFLPKKKKSFISIEMKQHRFDYDICAHTINNITLGPKERTCNWNKLREFHTTYSIDNNENIAKFDIPGKKYFSVTLDTDDWWEWLQ